MKKSNLSVTVFTLAVSCAGFANGGSYTPPVKQPSAAAIYVGVSGGYALTHWRGLYNNFQISGFDPVTGNLTSNSINATKENGFAGRVYLGFDFNRYVAIETGYTFLPKAKLINSYTETNSFTNQPISTKQVNSQIKNYAVDFFLKLSLPTYKGLSVFTKIGGVYLDSKVSGQMFNIQTGKVIPATFSLDYLNSDKRRSHFGSAFGFGLEYAVNRYISLDASYMHYVGDPKVPNTAVNQFGIIHTKKIDYQPSPDVFLAGIRFRLPTDTFS